MIEKEFPFMRSCFTFLLTHCLDNYNILLFACRSIEEVRQFFKPLNLQFGSKWRVVSTKLWIPAEGYLTISVSSPLLFLGHWYFAISSPSSFASSSNQQWRTIILQEKSNVCLGILDGSNVHDGSAIILGGILS